MTPDPLLASIADTEQFASGSVATPAGGTLCYANLGADNALLVRDYDAAGRLQDSRVITGVQVAARSRSASSLHEMLGAGPGVEAETGVTHGEANSLQTEAEAVFAGDAQRVADLIETFAKGTWRETLGDLHIRNLIHTVTVPTFGPDGLPRGLEPVAQVSYLLVADQLIPELVLWDEDSILICSRRQVDIQVARRVQIEYVQKSSKISASLGLALGSVGGMATTAMQLGEAMFSQGQPLLGSDGKQLSASVDMVRRYARLTFRSFYSLVLDIGAYAYIRVPRRLPGASS